jgi:hypothetical protein
MNSQVVQNLRRVGLGFDRILAQQRKPAVPAATEPDVVVFIYQPR